MSLHASPENLAREDTLVGIGVDYVTATAVEVAGNEPLHCVASSLFRCEAERGNQPRPWGMSGFKGWRCGSVEVGKREKETIVRISSDVAANSWRKVVQYAGNVSRIDLQATVLPSDGPTKRIDRHKRQARIDAKKSLDHKVVRWIQDNREGYTLYLGQRTSICFGRIYDKFQQSKMDCYKGCVRYEVQYHNKLALNIALALSQDHSTKPRIAGYCSQFFSSRGVDLVLPYQGLGNYSCSRQRSDADRNLAWLRSAVRPTVLRLIALQRGEEVLRALGLVDDNPPE